MFEIMLIFFGILAILFLATVAPLVKFLWDTDPDSVLLRPAIKYSGRLILVLLAIGITLLLTSCGKSGENDFAISRLADMITVYWVLPANTEVAHFQLNDNVLEIETDIERFSDRLVGRKQFDIVCQKHETLQLTGMSRLNDIAIFHLRVHPVMKPNEAVPYDTHLMWKWIDGEWREAPQIVPFRCDFVSSRPDSYLRNMGDAPGNFTAAKTFRSADRITAFWQSPGKPLRWLNQSHAEKGLIKGGIGERGIGLPDNWIQRMSITDIKPHESITCIGVGRTPEIHIAYFSVSQNPNR